MSFPGIWRKMSRRLTLLAFLFLVAAVTITSSDRWWSGIQKQWSLVSGNSQSKDVGGIWNDFHHLGGNGPWIPRRVDESNRCPVPKTCAITQMHMISRHAERYPTLNAGQRHISLLKKLHDAEAKLSGSLSFVTNWTYFTNLSDPQFEKLTSTGPYAGTLQAYNTGKKLRSRYGHLVPAGRTVNFWSCDSPRDIETARFFADGFFGSGWEMSAVAKLHIISESQDRGGDTLTPGRSCRKYRDDPNVGRADGYSKLAEFQAYMARAINKRLSHDAGGTEFSPLEIYGMMELCGFEILVRGVSPWCKVFTHDEWKHYEYARDLLHFYRAGPGNPYAGALGWLWLNATKQQLANDTAKGAYHSFVHDGDIIPLLATLGLFNEEGDNQYLPVTEMKEDRRWKTSDVVPMGGRLVLERIDCAMPESHSEKAQSYVRLIVNEGLFDLKHVDKESGVPCAASLQAFQRWVNQKGEEFGDFRDICGIGHDIPGKISFLHQ